MGQTHWLGGRISFVDTKQVEIDRLFSPIEALPNLDLSLDYRYQAANGFYGRVGVQVSPRRYRAFLVKYGGFLPNLSNPWDDFLDEFKLWSFHYSARLTYLSVPVQFGFTWPKGVVRPFAAIGVFPSFLIAQRVETQFDVSDYYDTVEPTGSIWPGPQPPNPEYYYSAPKTFGLRATGECGLTFALDGHVQPYLAVKYEQGLLQAYQYEISYYNNNVRWRSIGLLMGIEFTID